MAMTKVGPKHQVTIPMEAFEKLKLEVGDYLDVHVHGNTIRMVPKKFVSKEDAWFHSPEWQEKERQADEAIAAGDVAGPFSSADELLSHLGRGRGKAAKKKKRK